ncbi:MAG: LysE family translocator [Proteobacteria bacterium]|nr:LysE family translocator [Pseudomonadota bacterium]
MLDTSNLGVFVMAGLLLNITPGADILFIASRSAAQGTKAGIIAALGIGAGCLVHIVLAALGLSVVLATSAVAFTFVKLGGAAYLVYLGLGMLFSLRSDANTRDEAAGRAVAPLPYAQIFRQAILVNILNPKVALFFMAFLPQFVAPDATHPAISFLFLGCLFNCNGTIVNVVFAVFSAKIASKLKRHNSIGSLMKTAAGCLFIGLGVRLALVAQK